MTTKLFQLYHSPLTKITLHPEYDYLKEHQKIESSIRTQTGEMFRYKFGKWLRWRFSISQINEIHANQINLWWEDNTNLIWRDGSILQSHHVILVNRKLPLGQYSLPYSDRYRGQIELESYKVTS